MPLYPLGTVRTIYRYPVKSMAGAELAEAPVGWHGLADDRRFAFRRVGDPSGFPWLTATKLPGLIRYRPYYAPDGGVRVVTPDGEDLELASEALRRQLSAEHGAEVELMRLDQGIYDEAKLSLISTATIGGIGAAAGVALEGRRFRPNLLVDLAEDRPFVEDAWVGQVLAFGQAADAPAIHITMLDLRCSMINLDPDTAASDPRVLKAAGRLNNANAGVYATPMRLGTIAVGDQVFLVK